jgi:hypothetical protein
MYKSLKTSMIDHGKRVFMQHHHSTKFLSCYILIKGVVLHRSFPKFVAENLRDACDDVFFPDNWIFLSVQDFK